MDDHNCHDHFIFILYLLSRSTVLAISIYFNKEDLFSDHVLGKEIEMLEKKNIFVFDLPFCSKISL